jgi:hypothetical protein
MAKVKMLAAALAVVGAMALGGVQTARAEAANADSVTGVLKAFDSDSYKATLYAGEPTDITVTGDGGTKLAVFLYDGDGKLVDSDVGYTCRISGKPRYTDRFTIKIVNLGADLNVFTLEID